MAISLDSLIRKANPKPPIILTHGLHGLGKTSFGAAAPSPVAILTEDGIGKLDMPHFPKVESYGDVIDAIAVLYNDQHEFKTLVFDSIDHFEPMIWAETCKRNGWNSIEQPGYGKGYIEADRVWAEFFSALTDLRNDREMIVYVIAHTQVETSNSPEAEPFDFYNIKLHKRARALLLEKSDCVFYMGQRVSTVDNKTEKDSVRGGGLGPRTIYSERRSAWEAKNRYDLPPEIPMGKKEEMPGVWDNILECIFN